MAPYTQEAVRQIARLTRRHERLGRDAALRNLRDALADAETRIDRAPEAGLPAPRPYPALIKVGRLWIKARSYRTAYDVGGPVILAVFHETADIASHT